MVGLGAASAATGTDSEASTTAARCSAAGVAEDAGAAADPVLPWSDGALPSSVCPSTRSGVFGTARTCGAAAIPITVDGFSPLPMISAAVTHTTANPSKGRSCSPLTISSHPQTSRNGAYRTHASG